MIAFTDETALRADLATRHETKYGLTADVATVRRLLLRNTRQEVYSGPVSVVRSVYFDDASLAACKANLQGLARRRKLRLRWYDQPTPSNQVFLEVKWRQGRVTGKHRLRVECASSIGEMTYGEIRKSIEPHLPSHLLSDWQRNWQPIVLVEYRREHFVTRSQDVRLTIDYDIAFYDQVGRAKIMTAFPWRDREFSVLEVKTAVDRAADTQHLWNPLALRASRCSKYVAGCRAIGLIKFAI
ncbi:MAG: VTC domain-containing protein [Planctomycetales bacterium]|nr:VTC domain-containing protein [Planctomycetales bacterium]MCA9166053.1 VTC domain-containing protein [Planctomycetales bacterium]